MYRLVFFLLHKKGAIMNNIDNIKYLQFIANEKLKIERRELALGDKVAEEYDKITPTFFFPKMRGLSLSNIQIGKYDVMIGVRSIYHVHSLTAYLKDDKRLIPNTAFLPELWHYMPFENKRVKFSLYFHRENVFMEYVLEKIFTTATLPHNSRRNSCIGNSFKKTLHFEWAFIFECLNIAQNINMDSLLNMTFKGENGNIYFYTDVYNHLKDNIDYYYEHSDSLGG